MGEMVTLAGYDDSLYQAAYRPDAKRIATASSHNTVSIWDAEQGRLILSMTGHSDQVESVAWSPDGRRLVSGADDDTVKVWDAESGKEIRTLSGHSSDVNSVAFSSDGRRVVSGSLREIKVWDANTGALLQTLSGHTSWVWSVAFSLDGRRIVSASGDKTVKVWDADSGRELRTLSGHTNEVNSAAFSPNGRRIVSASDDRTVKVWDAESGSELRSLSGHTNWIWSAAYSPDGRYIISSSADNDIKVWDAESGKEIRTLTGLLGTARSVRYSPDGKRILSGAMDGTVRIWDAGTGAQIAQLVGFTDGEWVAVSADGYYNASPRGDERLNVRIGGLGSSTIYTIDQYQNTFYKPNFLTAALTGRPVVETVQIEQAASFAPPVVAIRSPEGNATLQAGQVDLSVLVQDQQQPIKTIRVLVNGRLVGSEETGKLTGNRGLVVETSGGIRVPSGEKRVEFRFPLSLSPGENRIEVLASNGYSEGRDTVSVTWRNTSAATQTALLPNLWILAIGINKYDDPALQNLNYCVNDAREIINTFRAQEGKLYKKVNYKLIADGSGITPTRDNIIDNFDYLKQAGQHDVVLLFLAGHGMNDDSGKFFFLLKDAAFNESGSIRTSRAIPNSDIISVLDVPGQKLLFLDSCHSEGASGKRTRAVDNNSLVRDLQDRSTVIFSSSRGSERSQERDEYKQGLFTWVIMEGMKGAADLYQDGIITMKELDTYVSARVPALSGGAQHPTTSVPDGYRDFNVAKIR
ncbi:hypothetical protein FACS1894200_01880 [Spirochaetia bacterium]|nr:hypothetical protein FACS1894200_01880 [Spirochaetia bacterium]